MVRPSTVWIEDIAERVGHYGSGLWLIDLGRWIGAMQPFPPVQSARFLVSAGKGVEVQLHYPAWRKRTFVSADDWVLYDATIDASLAPLPFHLSSVDTADTVGHKLSSDIAMGEKLADGTQKVSYFLPDFRVFVVTFKQQLVGVKSVQVARLYSWSDWRQAKPAVAPWP